MNVKVVREMRDAAPFKAFEIQLADGRAVSVATPDHLFFVPDSREFLVMLPGGGFRIIDSFQVVRLGRNVVRAQAR